MSTTPHVIERQHLYLHLTPGADGRAVQQQAETALRSRALLDALDAALSATGPPNDWLTLDRLEVDLGHLDSNQLERQLLDRLPSLLRQQVAELLAGTHSGAGSAGVVVHSAASTVWAAWLHFLRTGTLPPHWPAPETFAAWETDLLALLAGRTDSQSAELRAALTNATVRQRLVQQFSMALCLAVVGALDASVQPHQRLLAKALTSLLRQSGRHSRGLGERLVAELLRRVGLHQSPKWPALLAVLEPRKSQSRLESLSQLTQAALSLVRSSPPAEIPTGPHFRPAAPAPPVTVTEFVPHAGVVLLHPFLPACFAACGWLSGDAFSTKIAQNKAVLLVHFLATGATQAPEYELQIPKLLCGMPATASPSRRLRLSRTACTEALALMTAAISHWPALKNTSPDGLREAFLQREGKLEIAPDGNHSVLTVEQRAQDVLLDRLPYGWGLGVVQLPWMPARLTIHWT